MELYSNEEYSKAYTELLEILKTISRADLDKIPQDILEFYISNRDKNHSFLYNDKLRFKDPSMMQLTKILFANLYTKYWTTNERKQEIRKQDMEELIKIEDEKRKYYSADNMFYKRKSSVNETEETSLILIEHKSIFAKIVDKVKKWLKLT